MFIDDEFSDLDFTSVTDVTSTEAEVIEDESYPLDSVEAKRWAYARGLRFRSWKPDEIILDINTKDQLTQYRNIKPLMLRQGYMVQEVEIKQSKTPGHKHIYLNVRKLATSKKPPMTDMELIAIAAALGTDPKWVINSLRRLNSNDPDPFLIFELPKGD